MEYEPNTTAVCGLMWGDEGLGPIVSRLSEDADISVRTEGSGKESRTVYTEKGELRLNMLPSGSLNPEAMSIMSIGSAVNLSALSDEMADVKDATGEDLDSVFIDSRASLIMPWHLEEDPEHDGENAARKDAIDGLSLRAGDILDSDSLLPRLEEILRAKNTDKRSWSLTEIMNLTNGWKGEFADHIIDTMPVLKYGYEGGQRIIVEGDGGALRDIHTGAWPYSEPHTATVQGMLASSGIPVRAVKSVIGVMTAYSATDAEGPFITETSDVSYLTLHERTGKKRCGWLDLIALDYAASINGATELAVTDLSALDGMKSLRLSSGYMVSGEYYMNLPETRLMKQAKPIYDELEGWSEDTTTVSSFDELPENAKKYIAAIEEALSLPVTMITVGKDEKRVIAR